MRLYNLYLHTTLDITEGTSRSDLDKYIMMAIASHPEIAGDIEKYKKVIKALRNIKTPEKKTTTESINEGFWRNLFDVISAKFNDLTDISRNVLIGKIVRVHPELNSLIKIADKSGESIKNDELFWSIVNRATNGKAAEIKQIADKLVKEDCISEAVIDYVSLIASHPKFNGSRERAEAFLKQMGIDNTYVDIGTMKRTYKKRRGDISGAILDLMNAAKLTGKTVYKGFISPQQMRDANRMYTQAVIIATADLMKKLQQSKEPEPTEPTEKLSSKDQWQKMKDELRQQMAKPPVQTYPRKEPPGGIDIPIEKPE